MAHEYKSLIFKKLYKSINSRCATGSRTRADNCTPASTFVIVTNQKCPKNANYTRKVKKIVVLKIIITFATSLKDDYRKLRQASIPKWMSAFFDRYRGEVIMREANIRRSTLSPRFFINPDYQNCHTGVHFRIFARLSDVFR